MKRAGLLAALALFVATPFAAASAQQPMGAAPGSQLPTIDRDRADRITPNLPASAPRLSAPLPTANVAAQSTALALVKLRYEGASLAPALLDQATADYIGRPLTPENLKGIADAIGKAYAGSDIAFYSVMIPAQTLDGGILTVRVTEGAVTQYVIKGLPDSASTDLVKAHIKRIMQSTPLRKSVLERSLSLIRDMPGQTADAGIRQLDGAGALLLEITLKRRAVNISLTLDNNGIANVISAFQAQVAVTANNVIREGDSTRVSAYLPIHPDRYQFYSASHTTPLGTNGMTATVTAARIETRSTDVRIKGEATLAGISVSYPIIRSYKTNLSATASLDGIDSSNYYLDTRFGDYRSRALRGGLSWSKSDEKSGYAVSAVVSRGLDAFGARAFAGFSETEFTKVNVQTIAVRTIRKNLLLKLTANGQYSGDKLPATERLALGGPGAGRSFRIGTLTTERGVTGMAELSWTLPKVPDKLKGSALYAFADGGYGHAAARPVYALPGQTFSLASAGGGVRLSLGKWRASVEVAIPVKRPLPGYSRAPRLFGTFGRSF